MHSINNKQINKSSMNYYNTFKSNNSRTITKDGFYIVKHPKKKPTLFWDSSKIGTYVNPIK